MIMYPFPRITVNPSCADDSLTPLFAVVLQACAVSIIVPTSLTDSPQASSVSIHFDYLVACMFEVIDIWFRYDYSYCVTNKPLK